MKILRHAALIACCVFAASSSGAMAQTTLRFANFTPVGSAYADAFDQFVEAVNGKGGQDLKLQVFHSGILGPDPTQQLKLVEDDIAQIAFVLPNFTPGRFPETEVTDLPFLFASASEGASGLRHLLAADLMPSLADYRILGMVTTPPALLHTVAPVAAPGDLAGLRLRSSGAIWGRMFELLGAGAVPLAGSEVSEAVTRGVIAGVLAEPHFVTSAKLENTVKHHLMLPFGGQTALVLMRRDRYEALSPAARAVLDEVAGEWFTDAWAQRLDASNEEAISHLRGNAASVVRDVDEAAREVWRRTLEPLYAEWTAKRPENAAILEAFSKAAADAAR